MSNSKICYMCDSPAITQEHAPPRCFFPEAKDLPNSNVDLRNDLVTVPSCALHNSAKSADDEYAMVLAVMHFENNMTALNQFSTKVIRALRRSPAFISRVFDQPRSATVGGVPTITVDVDLDRFYRVMEHTAHALAFSQLGSRLIGRFAVWSTAFRFPDLRPHPGYVELASRLRQLLKDTPQLGKNPEVFRYQLLPNSTVATALRMVFYNGLEICAFWDHVPHAGAA